MTFARAKVAPGWSNGELITAAQINAIDINQSLAVDGSAGGNYTPTAPVGLGGAAGGLLLTETAGAASNVKLASRDVTRFQALAGACDYQAFANTWETQITTGFWFQVLTGGQVFIPLHVPHGQVLKQVTLKYVSANYVDPPGLLPGTMPSVTVERIANTGAVLSLGATTDPSGTVAIFAVAHDITVPAIAATIDRTQYSYRVKVMGDDGANFESGSRILSLYTICTCTGYTEY